MNKYEHQANLDKLDIITSLIGFSKAIQKQVIDGYIYYFNSSCTYERFAEVFNHIDYEDNICEDSIDRFRRHKKNLVTISCKIFYPGGDRFYFVLMARPGCDGSIRHNFFRTRPYKNVTLSRERFTLNHYELLRVNSMAYQIMKNDSTVNVEPVSGRWTYGLTKKYINEVKREFKKLLKTSNTFKLNQLYYSLERLISYSQVRTDYVELRKFMANEINKMLKVNKDFRVSGAGKFYIMLNNLRVLNGIKIPIIAASELFKPSSLKKIKPPKFYIKL